MPHSKARPNWSVHWLSHLLAACATVCMVVVVIVAWRLTVLPAAQLPPLPYPGIILLVVHFGFVLSLQQLLAHSFEHRQHAWSYRQAFLVGVGGAVVLPLFFAAVYRVHVQWWYVGSAVLGSFMGGLLATAWSEGLCEVNLPASQQVQTEVRQRHLMILDTIKKGPRAKHLFDAMLALTGLIVASPILVSSIFLIWFEDPGPVFFIKHSVGKGGKTFHQYKMRTMIRNAEARTGPVLATVNDERQLAVGRVLRKTALDELPQLFNILCGHMSFVGPRPQRTVLVLNYLNKIPQYAERHAVRPGISGLAQVVGHYYLTPLQKLRFDRVYIRHVGIFFDLKLIVVAFMIVFWLRWQKTWNGRTPRHWVRLGNSFMNTPLFHQRWPRLPRTRS